MRSLVAILAGAVVVAIFIGRARSGVIGTLMPTSVLLVWVLQLGSLAVIAFLVGVVVKRRGWLAAAGTYVAGVALWTVVDLRPTPPWVPTDARGTWEAVIGMVSIGGPWSALCGTGGSWAMRARGRASARRGTGVS